MRDYCSVPKNKEYHSPKLTFLVMSEVDMMDPKGQ